MYVPGAYWISKSPLRAAGVLLLVAATAVVTCFWTDFCFWRAELNLKMRQPERAMNWVARSEWLRSGSSPEACLLQLRISRRLQDFGKVEKLLQDAVALGVSPREIRRERQLAMAQTHQFNAMQSQWSELLNDPRDDGPEIARAYYTWAMLRYYPGLAEKTLNLWHADYPEDAEPLFLKGRFYESQENWEGAEDSYRDACQLDSQKDEYRLALARALQERLNPKEAVPLYQRSLREDPKNVTALIGLAECEATVGNLESAVQLSQRAMAIDPDNFKVQITHGELLLAAGDAATAAAILSMAYQRFPEHSNLANSLAIAFKQCGRNEEAEPLFAFVAESRPHLDELLQLERKLQLDPDDLNLRMEIASITARYVSREDAVQWYENLLRVSPDFRPAREAMAALTRELGDKTQSEKSAGRVGSFQGSQEQEKQVDRARVPAADFPSK